MEISPFSSSADANAYSVRVYASQQDQHEAVVNTLLEGIEEERAASRDAYGTGTTLDVVA